MSDLINKINLFLSVLCTSGSEMYVLCTMFMICIVNYRFRTGQDIYERKRGDK